MRIQITDDEGNVLHVPALNERLERDLRELFPEPSALRPVRRASHRRMLADIERVVGELRELTRF